MKNNFSKKAWMSLLIILGSIIIASGAFYYFSNDIAAQAKNIATERQEVSGQNNALDSLAALKNDEPAAEGYSTAMAQLLPDQYGIVNFNSWLNTIAMKYGVTVTSNFSNNGSPAIEPTGSTPGSINFSLAITGPAGSITKFLKDAESKTPGFIFNLISFDYTSDSTGEHVNAQGTLFFRQ